MTHRLISSVELSLYRANSGITKLSPEVLAIPGFSSGRVRTLLNELMQTRKRYLEVGCWRGATAVSALYNNPFESALLIDNFIEFSESDVTEKILRENLAKFAPHFPGEVTLDTRDCFTVKPASKFDLFFYDGNHSDESQYRAFTHFDPFLTPTFTAVIDDWNWDGVRAGTFRAFDELGYKIERQWDIFTVGNCSPDWWNGLLIAIISH